MAVNKSVFPRLLIISVLLLSSCTEIIEIDGTLSGEDVNPENQLEDQRTEQEDSAPVPDPADTTPEIPFEPAKITPESASELAKYGDINPFFPPYVDISGDGRIAAAGWQTEMRVTDLQNGEEVWRMETRFPECRFGPDRYIELSSDGSLVAIVTTSAVEVWEVGGAQRYSQSFEGGENANNLTCGLDIPQIALSPDGRFLALSGTLRDRNEFTQYFQIIDMDNGEAVYRWDGSENIAHGSLYGPTEMGFSPDGFVLQTFDPTKFIAGSDLIHTAFRFWSTVDFSEIPPDSLEVKSDYPAGNLLFPVSEDNRVFVKSKLDGEMAAKIAIEGCTYDNPCQADFSPNGAFALVFSNLDQFQFKRDAVATTGFVFDLEGENLVEEVEIFARNTAGVALLDDASVAQLPKEFLLQGRPWWTYSAYFSGFHKGPEGQTFFIPQVHDALNPRLTFDGSCRLSERDLRVECQQEIVLSDSGRLRIDPAGGGYKVFVLEESGEELLAEIRNPESDPEDIWRLRFLDYASAENIIFLCLDLNGREETCLTLNTESNSIVEEGLDLFKFTYSPEIQRAAFIDRDSKSLVIYDTAAERSKSMRSYRAVAYPLKPVFLPGTEDILYVVQSVDTKKLFIEQAAATTNKVVKRFDIPELETVPITALSVSAGGDLWSVGDASGTIHVINALSGEYLLAIAASDEPIIDLTFSADGVFLSAMDRSGIISVWSAAK